MKENFNMSKENKVLLSWVCFIVSIFAFGLIFGPVGIYLGMKAQEEGASKAPMIANIITTVLSAMSIFLIF